MRKTLRTFGLALGLGMPHTVEAGRLLIAHRVQGFSDRVDRSSVSKLYAVDAETGATTEVFSDEKSDVVLLPQGDSGGAPMLALSRNHVFARALPRKPSGAKASEPTTDFGEAIYELSLDGKNSARRAAVAADRSISSGIFASPDGKKLGYLRGHGTTAALVTLDSTNGNVLGEVPLPNQPDCFSASFAEDSSRYLIVNRGGLDDVAYCETNKGAFLIGIDGKGKKRLKPPPVAPSSTYNIREVEYFRALPDGKFWVRQHGSRGNGYSAELFYEMDGKARVPKPIDPLQLEASICVLGRESALLCEHSDGTRKAQGRYWIQRGDKVAPVELPTFARPPGRDAYFHIAGWLTP